MEFMQDMQDPTQIGQPQQIGPQNPECDEFIDSIRNQVRDKGYEMSQIVSFKEIVQLLDSLSYPSTFNKNLFHTIVTSSGFSPDSPLSVEQFFSAFYFFFDSMIPNHEKLLNLNKQLLSKREEYQAKAIQARSIPLDTKTNESILICELIINNSNDLHLINDIEFWILDVPKSSMFQNNITTIPILKSQTDFPIKVTCNTSNGIQTIDEGIRIKDLFNQERERDYNVENVDFTIKYVLVDSKNDYYNIKLISIQEAIDTTNQNIALLNRSIASMTNVFKTQLSIMTSNDEPVIFKSEGILIEKEFDFLNSIEEALVRTTKVSYLDWNKISWYSTLAMCPFVYINFFLRFDIITLLFTCSIFGVYYRQINTVYLKRIVCMVLISFGIDFIWVFYYLDAWGVHLPYEWESETTIRKIMLVSGIGLMILKLLIGFSLWKLSLQIQLIAINEPLEYVSRALRPKGKNVNTSGKQSKRPFQRQFIPNKTERTNQGETTIRRNDHDTDEDA